MTKNQLVALGSSLVVVLAIANGLWILNPPAYERLKRLDQQRVDNLSLLSTAVNRFFTRTDHLPKALSLVQDGQFIRTMPVDPETGDSYTYQIVDDENYRLCANFSVILDENINDFWSHPAGWHCFDLNAM